MAVADVRLDPVLDRGLFDVGLDRRAVGDRLRRPPGLEPEAQGEHVRVRPDARVFEQVPGAAQVGAAFEDGVALCRAAFLQVPGRAHAGDAGAHDEDVKVLSHDAHAINAVSNGSTLLSKLSTRCKVAAVTTVGPTRTLRGRRSSRPSGDDREQAILATAERLLEERPLADISVDDLAKGAGLSRPTFYFYFPSKEAVLLTLLEPVIARADAEFDDAVQRPPADRDGCGATGSRRSSPPSARTARWPGPHRRTGAPARSCGPVVGASCRSGSTRSRP